MIKAAEEIGLREIIKQVVEHKQVHGIMIDVHPVWLAAWKHYNLFGEASLGDGYLQEYERYYRIGRLDANWNEWQKNFFFPVLYPIDIFWQPSQWNARFNGKSNLIVKILLRPGAPRIRIDDEGVFTVIQEHRSIPILASSAKSLNMPLIGGVSIGYGTRKAGTLGGILSDKRSGQKYGVSCGHVIDRLQTIVEHPAQADATTTTLIGNCVLTRMPDKSNTTICNPYNNAGVPNDMDVALIELTETTAAKMEVLNIGKVNGFLTCGQLHPNLAVEFSGRTSGYKPLVLGSIGVVNEVQHNGTMYCIEHLIELKEPSIGNLQISPPAHIGDSGAWIMAKGPNGNEWCGMVLGYDVQTGYGIMSEKILDFLKKQGYDLDSY